MDASAVGGISPHDRKAFDDRRGDFAADAGDDPPHPFSIDDRLRSCTTRPQRDRLAEHVHDLIASTRIRPGLHDNLIAVTGYIDRSLDVVKVSGTVIVNSPSCCETRGRIDEHGYRKKPQTRPVSGCMGLDFDCFLNSLIPISRHASQYECIGALRRALSG